VDECTEAIQRFIQWNHDGLINISSQGPIINPLSLHERAASYPVILTQSGDMSINEAFNGHTLTVVPGTNRDGYRSGRYVAVAPPEADIHEFIRFMAWLDSDLGNYIFFRYGIEGQDFGEIGGNHENIFESRYAHWFNENFFYFNRDDLRYDVIIAPGIRKD
jgi:hypothetical protein